MNKEEEKRNQQRGGKDQCIKGRRRSLNKEEEKRNQPKGGEEQ